MADPLLTSLCTICHTQAPKYRCPRCGTRTCSLPCVKKHKNWSSCNGERDPTVFIPREKLKTDAGIDHDYNFLTKIERSVERAEKILREEKDILPQEDGTSNPPPNKKARLHKGRSRGRVTLEDSSRRWDRNTIQRLQNLGINVSSVPYGMSRAKENKTSWNRRTRTINWQVEWLDLNTQPSVVGTQNTKPSRILHKMLDETPLYVGLAESQEYHRQRQLSDRERADEKKKASQERQESMESGQNIVTSAWRAHPSLMQDPSTAAWSNSILSWQGLCDRETQRDKYRFFLLKPRTPSKEPHKLIPLNPTDTLAAVLPGLDIIEFPTICTLPASSAAIPDGFVVENRLEKSKKRDSSVLVEYSSDEDGEVVDQGPQPEEEDNDTTSSSESD
ncbi:hypothetical protein F4779DRAFT_618614 [Xylariaceae sp. FL0662B]|nr:hypothetical protein F4779DRAFT_618614 [Xylariaceae sp. FL0662B]